ncbi:hypothetical protein C8F01DRAFT_1263067 [Mycena amicta]|nr:hypothetical protein C8F01DRAFT_1263067 [Mycena amicta]
MSIIYNLRQLCLDYQIVLKPLTFNSIIVGTVWNFWLFRYRHHFWKMWAYISGAALDTGFNANLLFIFVVFGSTGITMAKWWGNNADSTRDGQVRFSSVFHPFCPNPEPQVQFSSVGSGGSDPFFFGSNLDFGPPEPKVRFKNGYNPNLNPEPGFSSVRFGFERIIRTEPAHL